MIQVEIKYVTLHHWTVCYKFVYLMYYYVVLKWLIFVDPWIINMTASSAFVIFFKPIQVKIALKLSPRIIYPACPLNRSANNWGTYRAYCLIKFPRKWGVLLVSTKVEKNIFKFTYIKSPPLLTPQKLDLLMGIALLYTGRLSCKCCDMHIFNFLICLWPIRLLYYAIISDLR